MKKCIFQKTAALILSGTMMFLSNHVCLQTSIMSEAVSNKARVSVHDPSIIKAEDGTYYVWGSHIDAAKSTDLQNWTRFTNGYTTPNNVEFGDLSQNLKKHLIGQEKILRTAIAQTRIPADSPYGLPMSYGIRTILIQTEQKVRI